ncbi:MAG TPA: hypothetical protein VG755_09020 [Nannocystaceae bacterium]|nr:hypothetical protein [Nannocystaceae bacterium]
MKKSITWGALVGVALGATVTFALSHGWVELPWSAAAAAMPTSVQHDDAPTPGAIDERAPVRPLRPGGVRAGEHAPVVSRALSRA